MGAAHLVPGSVTPSEVVGLRRQLAGVGMQHAILNIPNVHVIKPLETFQWGIIPAVGGLQGARTGLAVLSSRRGGEAMNTVLPGRSGSAFRGSEWER